MKKKVISLVISTSLTNEQIERAGNARLCIKLDKPVNEGLVGGEDLEIPARNVRVLDSDSDSK